MAPNSSSARGLLAALRAPAALTVLCLLLSASNASAESAPGTLALYEPPLSGEPGADATGADGAVWFTVASPAAIDRIDSSGHLTEYAAGLDAGSHPVSIARGPDGNVWFTDDGTTPAIGRVTPSGEITEFSEGLPAGSHPAQIATGPDGAVWFTDQGSEPAVGSISPLGAIVEFKAGLAVGSRPAGIAAGPEGDLWFTDDGTTAAIGRLEPATESGEIKEFSAGLNEGSAPGSIAAGPDGELWFADRGSTPAIGHLTPDGETPTIEELSEGLPVGSAPGAISTGADGNLWFTDEDALAPALGRITALGTVTEFTAPPAVGQTPAPGLAPAADARLWFGLDAGVGSSIAAATTGAPVGQIAPSVLGSGVVGTPALCTGASWPGWNGSTPSSTAFGFDGYSWQLDGVAIEGAGGETYIPPIGDAGHRLSCRVTATYALPSVTEVAVSEAVTLAAPSIERSPTPPSATGTLAVSPSVVFSAAKSSCAGTTWTASSLATQWLLDGSPIAGATQSSFTPPRSDDGHALACRQTATSPEGSSSLTSASRTIHEQPPQPSWATAPASEQCSSPVCMQSGEAGEGESQGAYQQGGAWFAASAVRCVSAPWTSTAGGSLLPDVARSAQAHAVSMALQRMTASGPVTVASTELGDLGTARDAIDDLGSAVGAPFERLIASSYGTQTFAHGELWTQRFPGSIGQPSWFVAGQGDLLYDVSSGAAVEGSFQLLYNLTAADLGARLRCVAVAEDGPLSAPTRASHTSSEYTVSSSSRCAPQWLAPGHGPQPTAFVLGRLRCLQAPSNLGALGGGSPGLAVGAGAMRFSLYCALSSGCRGRLALAAPGGSVIAQTNLALGHGQRGLVRLTLGSDGRRLLRRRGKLGLAANLSLRAQRHVRHVSALRLFGVD
jgi:streptogramin lyase